MIILNHQILVLLIRNQDYVKLYDIILHVSFTHKVLNQFISWGKPCDESEPNRNSAELGVPWWSSGQDSVLSWLWPGFSPWPEIPHQAAAHCGQSFTDFKQLSWK